MVFQDMVFSNDEALVNDQEEEIDDSDQEEISVSCEQDVRVRLKNLVLVMEGHQSNVIEISRKL